MILEITSGDLLYDLAAKCGKLSYERYFAIEYQNVKNWPVMFMTTQKKCHDA